jgi:hypothetical protein
MFFDHLFHFIRHFLGFGVQVVVLKGFLKGRFGSHNSAGRKDELPFQGIDRCHQANAQLHEHSLGSTKNIVQEVGQDKGRDKKGQDRSNGEIGVEAWGLQRGNGFWS